MRCKVCGKHVFFGKGLCKECASLVPNVFREASKRYSDDALAAIIEYEKNPKFKEFSCTANYGGLLLDEAHGLFAVDAKLDKDGNIIDSSSVFYVMDIEEWGLYCTNPQGTQGNKVICDVEFSCKIDAHAHIGFTKIVARGVACIVDKITSDGMMEWAPPAVISMFRNMMNQMLFNESNNFIKQNQAIFDNRRMQEVMRAKDVFMLDPDQRYSLDDVKRRRNALIKALHPDNAGADDLEGCAEKVNWAYKVLKEANN